VFPSFRLEGKQPYFHGALGEVQQARYTEVVMCGRYRLTAKERYLRDHFGLDVGVKWLPRWNIAPTQMIPTIRQHDKEPVRIFSLMRWGLIPYWAKDSSMGLKTINAMSETAALKPVFRDAFKYRRCLVPADGFYEWKTIGPKQKQAYNFGTLQGSVFAFAGLWDRWRQADNTMLETCAILTTRRIHWWPKYMIECRPF
jgi:putative SOS response-associated peptidase YedK